MNGKEFGTLIGSFVLPGFGSYVGFCIGNKSDDDKKAAAAESARRAAAEPKPPPDYSAAIEANSDDSKTVTLAQIQAQEFALQQTGQNRQLQNAAALELSIEKLDTRLETSKLEFLERMNAEENRHVERMASDHARFDRLSGPSRNDTDVPAPEFDGKEW